MGSCDSLVGGGRVARTSGADSDEPGDGLSCGEFASGLMRLPSGIRPDRCLIASVVLICLSSAPYVQLSVRLARDGLDPNGWPYVYTYYGSACLAIALFAVDVVPLIRSRAGWSMIPAMLLGVWAIASVGWTGSPGTTPVQAVLMSSILLFGIWFGMTLTRVEQAAVLIVVLQALTVGSVIIVVLLPNSTSYLGSWTGLFANGNSLGPVAALGGVTLAAVMWAGRPRGIVLVAGLLLLLLDLFVAVRAGSDTALFAVAVAMLAAPVGHGVRSWRRRGWSPMVLVGLAVGVAIVAWRMLFVFIGPVTRAVGKDPTLSDRRLIWAYLREQISDRPIAGFGYRSFWDDPERVYPLWEITGSVYDSAHSSFMETWLGLGLVGLILVIAILVQGSVQVARTVWDDERTGVSIGVAAVFVFVAIENLTESMISYHSMFWVLLVSCAAACLPSERRKMDGGDEHRTLDLH